MNCELCSLEGKDAGYKVRLMGSGLQRSFMFDPVTSMRFEYDMFFSNNAKKGCKLSIFTYFFLYIITDSDDVRRVMKV